MKRTRPTRHLYVAAAALAIGLAGAAGCGKSPSHEAFVVEHCDTVRTQLRDVELAGARETDPDYIATRDKFAELVQTLCAELEASRSEEEARTIWREADTWRRDLQEIAGRAAARR